MGFLYPWQLLKVLDHQELLNAILMNEDDNADVSGQMCVCDLTLSGHITQMQPAFLKKAIMIWQESSPI